LGRAHENLLDLGESAAVEVDVFAQTDTPGLDHGAQDVDDELGAREVRGRLGQVHGGDLEQHEDVIAQHGLDRGLAKILDLF